MLCSINLLFVVNVFLHSKQWENVLPSPCVAFIWCLRGVGSVYDFGQSVHLKFFSFKWTWAKWRNISDLVPNFLEHMSHRMFRMLLQYLRCPLILTTGFRHFSHLFILVLAACVFRCSFRSSFDVKPFLQVLHLMSECLFLCLLILSGSSLIRCVQTMQLM